MKAMRGALIQVKPLVEAKMRLAGVLARRERAELVLAMLSDVLGACNNSGCFDVIGVVSSDSDVFWHAREAGAKPIAEPATLSGLNESLTFGQRYLARRVAVSELVILPADIPLARPDDIRRIVAALADSDGGVIVPSSDGGTNALALRPPEALPMCFGPDSAKAHLSEARARSIDAVELRMGAIAFDIDSPADLETLASLPVGAATRGWLDARAYYAAERA